MVLFTYVKLFMRNDSNTSCNFCAENLLSNCSSPTSNLVTEEGRFYKHSFFIFVFRSSHWRKITVLLVCANISSDSIVQKIVQEKSTLCWSIIHQRFFFLFLKYMNSWYKAIRWLKFCRTLDLSIVTHHVLVRCNSAIYTCMNRLGSAAFVFLFCVI